MKKFLFLLVTSFSLLGINQVLAGNYSKAKFGEFGIQHCKTLKEYQDTYVGQTVKYVNGTTPLGKDYDRNFLEAGGQFDTEYIIAKISGNDDKMTFQLVEKYGKKKFRLPVRNYDALYASFGKYFYCITEEHSLPLILIDKFNQAKLDFIGQKFAHYEVTDLIIGQDESKHSQSDYPAIYVKIYNPANEKNIFCNIDDIEEFEKASHYVGNVYPTADAPIHYKVTDFSVSKLSSGKYHTLLTLQNPNNPSEFAIYQPQYLDDFNALGREFTHIGFKCKYTVVGVERKSSSNTLKYIVENSINGNKKTISTYKPEIEAFAGDMDGHFTAILKKVEKPTNPAIRYGKTTSVEDKDITKYSYVDNFIGIIIFANTNQFVFEIKNVSPNTLKIIWNEAVFVDVDGATSKIMHSGIKYSERESEQPASTIIKNAKLEDVATPTANVFYNEALKKWDTYSLYRNAKQSERGQTLRLMLPIQVKDVVNEYIFEFELSYDYLHPELLI